MPRNKVLLAGRMSLMLFVVVTVVLLGATAQAAVMNVGKGVVKPGTFASPESCNCHGELQQQWATSMHAQALDDPVYRLFLDRAREEAGEEVAQYCETCHAPGAMMMGVMAEAQNNMSTKGVSCDFCHQVTNLTSKKPANVSLGFPSGGPDGIRRAQIMDPVAMHPAQGHELQTTSEICGACHNVDHPLNGLALESTYTEWKKSVYAEKGITCQNCHMGATPGTGAPFTGSAGMGAPARDNMFAMTFVGANVGQSDPEASTAMLKAAAQIELKVDEIVAPGQSTKASVRVTNTGAGHSIPTGLTDLRQMWLEIVAVDEKGAATELGRTTFGTVFEDAKGKAPAEVWDAAAVKSDNRIKAGETFEQTVDFVMPAQASTSKIVATLKYQSAPDDIAKQAEVKNPTTDMATVEKSVYASADAKAQAEAEEADNKSEQPTEPSNNTMLYIVIGVVLLVAVAGVVLVRTRKRP